MRKRKRPRSPRLGYFVLVLVLVLDPRYCRNCWDCRRAGKRLLARVPVDEQTLVLPWLRP
jgi:hypothetical protein